MIEKTSCHRILSQKSLSSLTSAVLSQLSQKDYHVQLDELPSFPHIYPTLCSSKAQITKPPPYPTKDSGNQDEVILMLHSSGSTGFPKPIPSTRRMGTEWANAGTLHI